ncbi:MAG: carbohydrate-binding family 9-like protein [Armatimonadota bacterium]
MRILLTLLVATLLSSCAWSQAYTEDFERGVSATASYDKADALKVEVGTTAAASGKQYARAVLPGKKALEGFYVTATGLTGGRVATATAKVRGSGELWLCLISANGWLYSPKTVSLTDQWQEVSLSKALMMKDKGMSVYFLSQKAQPGAIFEVDDVRVTQGPALQTFDAEVGPWRLKAEDFAFNSASVKPAPAAMGGKMVASEQYAALKGLPFPRTSRPVTIYAFVNAGSAGDNFRIATTQGGNTQYLQTEKAKTPGQWEWVRFQPVYAGETGDDFSVACWREKNVAGEIAIAGVVIATKPDLTAEQLAAAPLLFGTRPVAVVAKTGAAPVIDGKPDDACWRNTVACSGFMGVGSTMPAAAPTTVRLCYDDRNLYALYSCAEPILNTAQQRRHEFSAKVTQRDQEVYGDDSAVLLLAPDPAAKQLYDFTVNALGTICDAKDTAPDYWDQRDLKWNSGATAAGQIGEDLWTVEIAIPFADLGKTPQVGEAWQACLGRIAKARKESTSWNVSDKGFHVPVEFGTLIFGGATPGIEAKTPSSLQVGGNDFSVALTETPGQSGGAYLLTRLGLRIGTFHTQDFLAFLNEPQQVAQRFELAAEPKVRVSHAILDAATLQPLWMSPTVTRAVKSSLATLTLTCKGPYELTLNGEMISSGGLAIGRIIKAPLQTGANAFALKLEEGTAALTLEAPGSTTDASTWKIAAADPKAGDEADLKLVEATGKDPQLGAVVGKAGQPATLRKTVLWEKTRVWPTPEPAVYLARGAAQHLTFMAEGLKGRKLLDWTTYVAVPLDFEITGSTGFYGRTREQQPQFVCTQLGEQQVGGKPMRVAKITADKPLLSGQHPIMSEFEVFVRYREEAGEPKSAETQFVYWSEANGGSTMEPPQTVKVRLLPKLNGAQCKTLVWQLWGGWLSSMDNLEVREQILQCAKAAGFNDIVGGDRWTSDNAPSHGLQHTAGTNFKSWCLDLTPYLKEHPDQRLLKADGKPDDTLLCMTLLLGDGWKAAEQALQGRLDQIKPHTIDYDYEYGPFNGPHSCYCPLCLQAFREFAELPAGTALTPESIKEQHRAQWVDFMARRVAAMFARFKESVHRLSPGTLFSTYSGYQTPENPERYGIDWRYIGELQASDRVGCGYGRPTEAIAATIEGLKGIPLLGGALLTPYDTSITTPQTPLTTAWLLRVLLDSTGGVLVYDRCTFDGRSWYAMAEATRLAAAYEQVFLKGKRTAVASLDPAQVQGLSDGKTSLILVLNPSSKPATHKLTLPSAAKEFYSGKPVAAGPVEVTVAPGEAAVYVY